VQNVAAVSTNAEAAVGGWSGAIAERLPHRRSRPYNIARVRRARTDAVWFIIIIIVVICFLLIPPPTRLRRRAQASFISPIPFPCRCQLVVIDNVRVIRVTQQ
jgi:hypothetical protein